jgi:hypothetical protein
MASPGTVPAREPSPDSPWLPNWGISPVEPSWVPATEIEAPTSVRRSPAVARLEMVINQPEEFRVRRRVRRGKQRRMEWVEMRKGVGFLFRYREVSKTANERYLAALAGVEDPTLSLRAIDHLTRRKEVAAMSRGSLKLSVAAQVDTTLPWQQSSRAPRRALAGL